MFRTKLLQDISFGIAHYMRQKIKQKGSFLSILKHSNHVFLQSPRNVSV